ncbi:hypothetical protein AAC387_Pa08g1026 [Persea americana]
MAMVGKMEMVAGVLKATMGAQTSPMDAKISMSVQIQQVISANTCALIHKGATNAVALMAIMVMVGQMERDA